MERLVPVVDGQLRQRFWAGKDGNRLVENFIVKSACHFMLDCVAMKKGPEEEEVLAAMENIRAMLTGIWWTDTGKTVSLRSFNFKRYSKEDVLSQPAKVKILTLFSELCTYRK